MWWSFNLKNRKKLLWKDYGMYILRKVALCGLCWPQAHCAWPGLDVIKISYILESDKGRTICTRGWKTLSRVFLSLTIHWVSMSWRTQIRLSALNPHSFILHIGLLYGVSNTIFQNFPMKSSIILSMTVASFCWFKDMFGVPVTV